MAPRSSNLDDSKPEIKTQTEGHTLTLTSSWNSLEDPEAFWSAPSQSPSWSLVRKPTPDWPKTQCCLEIQVISTEYDEVISPPYTWQVPIVEDMVWQGRADLMKAVVTSPGRAIFFYGWQSLGEGLSLGDVRDATFTLSGVIAWVGIQAQLKAKLVSHGDGWQLIAQAIAKGHMSLGGLVALIPFHLHCHHSIFIIKTCHHDQPTSQLLPNGERCPGLALGQESRNGAGHHSEVRTEARDNKKYGSLHHSCLCFHQIMDLRVIGAQHQLHHQCCQGLRGQEDWDIHTVGDIPAGNQEAIWKLTCQSLRMRTLGMPLHNLSWHWDLTVYHDTRYRDHTFLPYAICSLQVSLGSW